MNYTFYDMQELPYVTRHGHATLTMSNTSHRHVRLPCVTHVIDM